MADSDFLALYQKEVDSKKEIVRQYYEKKKELQLLKNELEATKKKANREQLKADMRSMLVEMKKYYEGLKEAFEHFSGKCQKILTFFEER